MFILPLIILIPFIAGLATFLFDKSRSHVISIMSSAAVLILTIAAVYLANAYGLGSVNFSYSYIPALNLSFQLQFSQISLILTVMTAIVFFAASLVSNYFIKDSRLYNLIFLIAEGASLGVFLSSNLFLLYVFWEISEVMMFFIIFIFGGYGRRYAAMKFIIYSLLSSFLLLIAIILLYVSVIPHTFDIGTIASLASSMPAYTQLAIMSLMLVAFMIKMPIFPFHTWLPDAHTEAPTTGSMILAGVLLKFGGYGLLLMFMLVPISHSYMVYMAIIFGFSAVYAAFVTFRQTNLKRLIAYTSITDMGIVAVGVAASSIIGTSGALYGMLSHAIAISVLFLIAGTLDEVYGTLEIERIKGVVARYPALTYIFIAGVFALVGLPLTSGFIGDLLIFIGSFHTFGMIGIVPLAGIFAIGAALFWTIERSFYNESRPTEPYNVLGSSVIMCGAFLIASTIVLGVLPFILTNVSGL
jgi:NADH-quinone oxidoreductase subunit M